MYRMTNHARIRCQERQITTDKIAAALASEPHQLSDKIVHIDRKTRTVLIISDNYIVTAYRAGRVQFVKLWNALREYGELS